MSRDVPVCHILLSHQFCWTQYLSYFRQLQGVCTPAETQSGRFVLVRVCPLCASYNHSSICTYPVPQCVQWINTETVLDSELNSGQIILQLLQRLVAHLAQFGPGEDFCPRRDITGTQNHGRFQKIICQMRSAFSLNIVRNNAKIVHKCNCCRTPQLFLT